MQRVVVTGIGVFAPNGHGKDEFAAALREGRSGISFREELAALGFHCQIAGVPPKIDALKDEYFAPSTQIGMDRYCVIGCIAALDAWRDAEMNCERNDKVDWDTGIVFGVGFGPFETIAKMLVPMTDAGKVSRLGSAIPERTMGSSVTARLAGLLGLGGQTSTISSACATGSDAILNGYWMVREGRVKRALVGSCEGDSPYLWAGFDAMRVLCRNGNQDPARGSRPLSATASGFVPSAGAGALIIESLDSALSRGARIYAELAGGAANCGGQRNGGTMTAGNSEGIQRCIRAAIENAGVRPEEIDLISGHLTATMADRFEINNWRIALNLPEDRFPLVNAPKSLIGHTLGAAGAIEAIAAILQLCEGFVHPSINCEDLHPELDWCRNRIPCTALQRELHTVAKSSFGFGDVNTCLVFRRYSPN